MSLALVLSSCGGSDETNMEQPPSPCDYCTIEQDGKTIILRSVKDYQSCTERMASK